MAIVNKLTRDQGTGEDKPPALKNTADAQTETLLSLFGKNYERITSSPDISVVEFQINIP